MGNSQRPRPRDKPIIAAVCGAGMKVFGEEEGCFSGCGAECGGRHKKPPYLGIKKRISAHAQLLGKMVRKEVPNIGAAGKFYTPLQPCRSSIQNGLAFLQSCYFSHPKKIKMRRKNSESYLTPLWSIHQKGKLHPLIAQKRPSSPLPKVTHH